MTATIIRLTGDSLVSFVNEKMELINRGEMTRTQMIQEAGYYGDNRTYYTDFYTELLNAKGIKPVTDTDLSDTEYDDLTGVQQDLYNSIHDKFGSKWDHEQIMEFMDELDDIGIETPEQLDESYEYQTDEWNPEKVFAEYFITEVLGETIPSIFEGYIDWEGVWQSSLRYDYNTIEFDGEMFFFRNI
jgi:hypothetical protein